ncbi:bifunctional riboflavin kinase/FAD synthetase [Ekhidna sp. To15]|uniref:bifunctional riboflavin kinase/FAD synthetase n=1 Tax=Ekhidna sp. To15 TaxID=3395267 RepID=UPI003F520D82
MRVVDHLEDFEKPDFAVVTIGTFDGVHIGHQTILKRLVKEAKSNGGQSVLITFWPHPRFILNKDADKLKLLSTFDEKVKMVAELGVDFILKVSFTPEFSKLSADQFVKQILVDRVGTKKLFIGYDHHFGNNREGNIQFLKKNSEAYGFEVNEISKQEIDHIGISSTKIRSTLESGEIHLANSLLGRNYSICGRVVDGNKKGRSLGFPTANIKVPETYKLLPADGAYAIRAIVSKETYLGMLNIGFKPTVNGQERTIEAHLFNFEADIYGQEMKVDFIKALRKEMKFDSLEALKEQLNKDKEIALSILT